MGNRTSAQTLTVQSILLPLGLDLAAILSPTARMHPDWLLPHASTQPNVPPAITQGGGLLLFLLSLSRMKVWPLLT